MYGITSLLIIRRFYCFLSLLILYVPEKSWCNAQPRKTLRYVRWRQYLYLKKRLEQTRKPLYQDANVHYCTRVYMILKCYSEWKPHWAGWRFCPTTVGIEPTTSRMLAMRSTKWTELRGQDGSLLQYFRTGSRKHCCGNILCFYICICVLCLSKMHCFSYCSILFIIAMLAIFLRSFKKPTTFRTRRRPTLIRAKCWKNLMLSLKDSTQCLTNIPSLLSIIRYFLSPLSFIGLLLFWFQNS